MNTKSLSITNTIIHEITKAPIGGSAELILSDTESMLDQDMRDYFRERIVESLRLAAYAVVADPVRKAPTPELVHALFNDKSADFVQVSRAMGEHLFDAQQRVRSTPGLLVISSGT